MKVKSWKLEGRRRQTRHGSYSLTLSAVVIAAAVAVNLVVSELPSKYTKIDLSSRQLSVLTPQTEELLGTLSKDITIYHIAQSENEDENIARLLQRYGDGSSHITVVEKDPVRYPQFASQYTDETLQENSLIIVCGDQSRVIPYEDLYESEFNYQYYTYETTGFDAEGQITSALSALNSDDLPKLYTLTGHGELSLESSLTDAIAKENITTEELNLISADSVPEDADALLIASPGQDLSAAEAQKILNYLKRGGHAVIVSDYTEQEMPNLESVFAQYGMARADGVVIENNNNYFVQLPYYLLPRINTSDVSADLADGGGYVLMAAAQGLQKTEDLRDSLTVTGVLSTSDASYSKTDVQNMTTYQKEEGDVDGPFDVGMIATETVELTQELLDETASVDAADDLGTALDSLNIAPDGDALPTDETAAEADGEKVTEADGGETTEADEDTATETVGGETTEADGDTAAEEPATAQTRLAVFTSSSLLDASADQMVSGGNYRLLTNTLSWLCGSENSVSIPAKSLSVDYLTVPAASSGFWSIVTIGVIPAAFLLTGLFTWLRRRKQ